MSPRRLLFLLLCLAVAGCGGTSTSEHASRTFAKRQAALGECLKERAAAAKKGEREEEAQHGERECVGAPESGEDLAKIGEAVTSRLGSSDARGALTRGIEQRNRLRARAPKAGIPGTGGTWTPYGMGPLRFDDPTSPAS